MTLSVLVAHDDRDDADALALMLRVLGYRVGVTYDARQALAAALAAPPDYFLAWPDPEGCALAREVRRHAALNATILVAVTGSGDPAQATAAGFQHCVRPDELQQALPPPWLTRA
jgi:CheY-like chemotaxis protein